MKKIFFILLLFVVFNKTHSETLEELIYIAKKNNPDIKRIEKELSVLKQKYKSAGRLPNPTFSLNIKDDGAFTVFQYIPWYEKLSLQREIEERRYQIQTIVYQQEKNKIIRQIMENGFLIWFYRERLKINNNHLEIIEHLLTAEKITQADKNKLRILKTNIEIQNQDLQQGIAKLISDLKVLTNYDFKDLTIDTIDVPEMDEKSIKEKSENASLLIRQIDKQIERENLSYKLAKEIYMPDLGVSVTYKAKNHLQDVFSLGVNLYINVPIWRRLNQEQTVLEQKLQSISAQEKRINALNQVIWSIDNLITEYNFAKEKLKILKDNYETYKSDLDMTIKNFIEGRENINNLILSITENINVQNKINQEKLSAIISFLKIQEAFGEL